MGFQDATLRNGLVKNPSFRTSPPGPPPPHHPHNNSPRPAPNGQSGKSPRSPARVPTRRRANAIAILPDGRSPSRQLPAPSGPPSPIALLAVPLASQLPRAVTAPHATDAHAAAPVTHLPADPRASAGKSPKRGVRSLHARERDTRGLNAAALAACLAHPLAPALRPAVSVRRDSPSPRGRHCLRLLPQRQPPNPPRPAPSWE